MLESNCSFLVRRPGSRSAEPDRYARSQSRCGLVILLCIVGLFPIAAAAQTPGGGFGGSGRGGMHQSSSSDDAKCPTAKATSSTIDRVNLELEASRAALGLSSEQEPAWSRFEASTKKLLRDLVRGTDAGEISISQMFAPQLIDQALDRPRDHLTALEDVGDSAKQLYQVLSPEQKKIADARLPKVVRLLASDL